MISTVDNVCLVIYEYLGTGVTNMLTTCRVLEIRQRRTELCVELERKRKNKILIRALRALKEKSK